MRCELNCALVVTGLGAVRERAPRALSLPGPGRGDRATRGGRGCGTILPRGKDRLQDSVEITVDLETMTVTTPFQDRFPFELDSFRRDCLMQGLDEIGLTLARHTEISKYEDGVASSRPWIATGVGNEGAVVEGAGRA